jgi:hypothetical protein
MRVSLPERISMAYAFLFAALLFLLQQMERTSLYFSACSFLFVVISTYAFNVAGGLTRASGGYIFFYSLLAVILGLTVKVFTGEAGDSNLLRPHLTITVYAATSVMLLLSAAASRKFSRKRPLLEGLVSDSNLARATVGCLVLGIVLSVATRTLNRGSGTVFSALLQINRFSELAIILGVTHAIRSSGGRRSINVPVILASFTLVVLGGLFGFSKEGFFTPPVCWALAAGAQRLRLSLGQILSGILLMLFLSYYMVPYSQYGRTQMQVGLRPSLQVTTRLLSNLNDVRRKYEAEQALSADAPGGYFNKSQGIFNRLQMISIDDLLHDATERQGVEGFFPLWEDFENLVPHMFWPGKPSYLWGNIYAHEAGVPIGEDDFFTGISFSPAGEGYHLGKWTGILIAAPLLWTAMFMLFDSLCGDVRRSPWGLLAISYFAHGASEGMLGGVIYAMGFVTFAIVFAALLTGYIMPLLGSLFIGPGSGVQSRRSFPLAQSRRAAIVPSPGPPID